MNDFIQSDLSTLTSPPYNSYDRLIVHNMANLHGLGHFLAKDNLHYKRKCMVVRKDGNQKPHMPNLQVYMLHHGIYSPFKPIRVNTTLQI